MFYEINNYIIQYILFCENYLHIISCIIFNRCILAKFIFTYLYSRLNYYDKAFVFKFGMNEIKVYSLNLTTMCELLNMKI